MDLMTSILAANRAKKSLEKNGQIGYTEDSIIEIVPEATYEFNQGSCLLPISKKYEIGTKIIIVIDGIRYSSIAKSFNEENDSFIITGNGSIVGLENTGEPYITMTTISDKELFVRVGLYEEMEYDRITQHKISMSIDNEIIHTIDPKYLPSISSGDSEELDKIKADGGVGYTEGSIIELVPEATYEFNQGGHAFPIPKVYDAGTEIIITIDGVKYNSILKSLDQNTIFAGNGIVAGLEDTGEPYAILMGVSQEDNLPLMALGLFAEANTTGTTQHNISIFINEGYAVHTIDPKYLPPILEELDKIKADGGVGYTEGSIIELVPEATYEFNQGECTIPISKIYNAGTEIIITIDGIRYNSISKLVNIDEQLSGRHIVVAGNGSIIGLVNTGEPYMVIMKATDENFILIVDLYAERESAQTTQHKISVSINNGVIHAIDSKYIHRSVFHFEDFGLPFFPTEAIEINEETATNIIKLLSSPSACVQINNIEFGEAENTTTIFDFPVISSTYIKDYEGVHFTASFCSFNPSSQKTLNAVICVSKSRADIWTFEYIPQEDDYFTPEVKQIIVNEVLAALPETDVHTPVKGTDYWTKEDQQTIVNDVLAALPTWEGGSY